MPVQVVLRLISSLTLTLLLISPLALANTDRLLRPALPSAQAHQSLLMDIALAGERLVAVGERGHIVYQDAGQDWQQASVPVISHLTGVAFATPQLGFAVGHEGMILRTRDGGANWTLVHHELRAYPARIQQQIVELEAALEQAQAVNDLTDIEWLEFQLEELSFLVEVDEVPPLLDVVFINEQQGFAVGGYNLLLMTEDGGDSWQAVGDRLPNEEELHNNTIIQTQTGDLFIAGERGSIYRSRDQGETWERLPLDYDGSVFGLFSTSAGQLFAVGLRGNLFVSDDQGDSWRNVDTGTEQTLNAGTESRNQLLIIGQNGTLLRGTAADNLQLRTLSDRQSLLSLVVLNNEVIAVGRGGVHRFPLFGL